MKTFEEIQEELQQYIGTTKYHILNMFVDTVATDGMKRFCELAEAYWLFDDIALMYKKLRENFLVVNVSSKNNKAKVIYETGNYEKLKTQNYTYTDLPEGKYKFYVIDNVILLPQEY